MIVPRELEDAKTEVGLIPEEKCLNDQGPVGWKKRRKFLYFKKQLPVAGPNSSLWHNCWYERNVHKRVLHSSLFIHFKKVLQKYKLFSKTQVSWIRLSVWISTIFEKSSLKRKRTRKVVT